MKFLEIVDPDESNGDRHGQRSCGASVGFNPPSHSAVGRERVPA
jgi:hypothetical protein